MGHATLGLNALGEDEGQARFRTPERALDHVDPICKVNEAVQAVLADLHGPSRSRKEPGCQVFLDKLFSVRHAEALSPGSRVLQVTPGTVITPLARDWLKRQEITIRLGSQTETQADSGSQWAFAIAVEPEIGTIDALRRALHDDPRPWTELEPSLNFVTSWLVEKKGRGVMFITSEAALSVWRSCQVPGVRAAAAAEPSEVQCAARSLGMNLLVIDPAGKSLSWIKRLAAAFRLAGAPRAPESLFAEDRA